MRALPRENASRLPVAYAIRDVRLALRVTQDELASYVRLGPHTIYRWEAGRSVPKRTTQRALLEAVALRNPQAAAQLKVVFDTHLAGREQTPATAPAAPAPAQPTGALALELAIFAMADELDLAPRRLRAALPKLLLRMQAAGYSVECARLEIEARVAARNDTRHGREHPPTADVLM